MGRVKRDKTGTRVKKDQQVKAPLQYHKVSVKYRNFYPLGAYNPVKGRDYVT